MMGPFTIASNDQSQFYLGYLFGTVGNVLTPGGTGATVIGVMAVLFKALNTAVLTLGVLIVIYTTVVGLLATAHEGEFMGKKWSGLWVPIRTVMGIALMFPVSSGYSAIQIIMMWIILQGVGAADVLWNTVLSYVSTAGSVSSTISMPSSSPSIVSMPSNMKNLYYGLVCQASAASKNTNVPPGASQGYYYCAGGNPDPFCAINSDNELYDISATGKQVTVEPPANSTTPGMLSYRMGPALSDHPDQGSCGTLTYSDPASICAPVAPGTPGAGPSSLGCIAATAGQKALQAIVPFLGAIAQKFVDVDHDYLTFRDSSSTAFPPVVITPPAMVKSFCSASNVAASQCCILGASSMSGLGGGGASSLNCVQQNPLPNGQSPFFPDDSLDSQAPTKFSNTSPDAVTKVYYPYAIKPYLGSSTDFITAAINEYSSVLSTAVAGYFSTHQQVAPEWTTAQANGWLFAGSYYFQLAAMNNSNSQLASPTLNVSPASPQTDGSVISNYRNNYNQASLILNAASAASTPPPPPGVPPQFSDVSSTMSSLSAALLHRFESDLSSGAVSSGASAGILVTPLANIQQYGQYLMMVVEVTMAVLIGILFIIVAIAKINFIALGFGLTEDPLGAAIQSVIIFTLPAATFLLGSLFVLGATLGIYVPLIPYIIFTMGAIGWFMAVVEAMVAAPLIALGILSPGGQHEILGRAEQSIFLILNLFLRPGLMVIGMIAAMLLSGIVITMINAGFNGVLATIMSSPGLFEQIIMMAIYAMLIVTSLNKVFSLIYVVPERITTWIDGHAVQYGEQESLGQIKQAGEAAAGGTGQALGAGGSALKQAVTERDQKGQKKKEGGTGGAANG